MLQLLQLIILSLKYIYIYSKTQVKMYNRENAFFQPLAFSVHFKLLGIGVILTGMLTCTIYNVA